MFKLLLFLHLLTAIFAIGPLAHAATTAARGLRTGDAAATATAARVIRIYSFASVAVVIFGFGLMSMDSPYRPGKVAEFGDPFIWVSTLLWLAVVAIALAVIVPTLQRATAALGTGESVANQVGKVAASGGVIGLLLAVIVVLMVWQPGS